MKARLGMLRGGKTVANACDQFGVGCYRLGIIADCTFLVSVLVSSCGVMIVVMAVIMSKAIARNLRCDMQAMGAFMVMGVRRRRRQDAVIGDGDRENKSQNHAQTGHCRQSIAQFLRIVKSSEITKFRAF